MLKIIFSSQFKEDYKRSIEKGRDPKKLEEVISLLSNHKKPPLDDYPLDFAVFNSHRYKNLRECYIDQSWVLIYKVIPEMSTLELLRTGSYQELL